MDKGKRGERRRGEGGEEEVRWRERGEERRGEEEKEEDEGKRNAMENEA